VAFDVTRFWEALGVGIVLLGLLAGYLQLRIPLPDPRWARCYSACFVLWAVGAFFWVWLPTPGAQKGKDIEREGIKKEDTKVRPPPLIEASVSLEGRPVHSGDTVTLPEVPLPGGEILIARIDFSNLDLLKPPHFRVDWNTDGNAAGWKDLYPATSTGFVVAACPNLLLGKHYQVTFRSSDSTFQQVVEFEADRR
jgi:hypothetical protein